MRFSLESYRALIRLALDAGFAPSRFDDRISRRRKLLLRHDVDFSLEMAVELARVNAEVGATGTFFILLRGHTYNAVSPKSLERLRELASAGQRLGLHVPPANQERLVSDFEFLRAEAPLDRVFAWHNPTPEVIERHRHLETVDGLVNVYSNRFLDDALYRSDSNLGNSYEQLVEAFDGQRDTVHLLIHPINWVAGGDSMIEVFENAWPYLIRESELDARTNHVYADRFPAGMPDSLLTEFAQRWRKAAS